MHGILLFAHGARDPAWARPFEAIAAHLRAQHRTGPVALSFLELMAPRLPEATADMVRSGCRRITVVPVFLGGGGHVRKDLPALIEQLRAEHPGVELTVTPALGEVDAIHRAMAEAALALAGTALDDAGPAA
ncbi:MAG TPA: CbiX/SirB N-terminal domain-containing protein [Burkholderiaceae bacterium]|nr:CbiX/SirB N-terminal domain-containing protein [Burkholderiaceae bacterium]HMX11267.1 CbiX/SirB N-terminal domain-containing protein [Burkholderiaceae bacterium]HMZ01151.1 CbiX/SirB N-terminal domain-containing protein [Burkholderiaceae bacterium]HNB43043.1 CbiX/SirB N-terminal domain-containing protein [Burkholderiaceae bacterium]HNG78493.1 CbiX/SirB N-terminal domain-containing protein [Burkholderiaceae bacterium]